MSTVVLDSSVFIDLLHTSDLSKELTRRQKYSFLDDYLLVQELTSRGHKIDEDLNKFETHELIQELLSRKIDLLDLDDLHELTRDDITFLIELLESSELSSKGYFLRQKLMKI